MKYRYFGCLGHYNHQTLVNGHNDHEPGGEPLIGPLLGHKNHTIIVYLQ